MRSVLWVWVPVGKGVPATRWLLLMNSPRPVRESSARDGEIRGEGRTSGQALCSGCGSAAQHPGESVVGGRRSVRRASCTVHTSRKTSEGCGDQPHAATISLATLSKRNPAWRWCLCPSHWCDADAPVKGRVKDTRPEARGMCALVLIDSGMVWFTEESNHPRNSEARAGCLPPLSCA